MTVTGSSLLCALWITRAQVKAVPGGPTSDADADALALEASETLYLASGRLYPGAGCTTTARPCRDPRLGCGGMTGVDSLPFSGHIVWSGWAWGGLDGCGCGYQSRVKLSGWPVTSIQRVRVGGVTVDPGAYRLDQQAYLTRIDGQAWPACQNLALAAGTPGTFDIDYTFGAAPPQLGIDAALALAAYLWKQSPANAAAACALPAGTTQVTREGLTLRVDASKTLSKDATTLPAVSLFLQSVNPNGRSRRPALFSPDVQRYARRT